MEEMKKKRFYAIVIDFFIACIMVWMVDAIISLIVTPTPPFLMFPTACAMHFFVYYFFCKDCYKGMSFGKRIMGLKIIRLKFVSHLIHKYFFFIILSFSFPSFNGRIVQKKKSLRTS